MAIDMHLKLEGGTVTFEGESKHEGFEKEIDIMSWSWGVSTTGSFAVGAGGSAGKPNIQDLSFSKYLDKSSTAFLKALVGNAHSDSATLTVSKGTGDKREKYFTIKLSPVMVSAYGVSGADGSDLMMENISLGFQKYEIEYFKQDDKGKVASAGKTSYDMMIQKIT